MIQEVRLHIYRTFADLGKAPSVDQISEFLELPVAEVKNTLLQLAEGKHLVLNEEYEIVMAHPFSSVPLGFSVMGEKTLWWGGCSWDSFALPNLLNQEVVVATSCPNCKNAHAWRVNPENPPQGNQIAHFLLPTSKMWTNVVFTCGNQRIFCNEICLDTWLQNNKYEKGYVMSLDTLWSLATRWYDGRLDLDYQRRDPSTASQYFRQVGLSGSFWGLD